MVFSLLGAELAILAGVQWDAFGDKSHCAWRTSRHPVARPKAPRQTHGVAGEICWACASQRSRESPASTSPRNRARPATIDGSCKFVQADTDPTQT